MEKQTTNPAPQTCLLAEFVLARINKEGLPAGPQKCQRLEDGRQCPSFVLVPSNGKPPHEVNAAGERVDNEQCQAGDVMDDPRVYKVVMIARRPRMIADWEEQDRADEAALRTSNAPGIAPQTSLDDSAGL